MDRVCESDTLSFLTEKAQGQRSQTPGEVIYLKVIFTEMRKRWREERNSTLPAAGRIEDG